VCGDVAAYICGYLFVCVCCTVRNYFRTVQRTYSNKDPHIYAATSPHTDVFKLAILTTVTLARSGNALPDYGVTASKHVGAL
jgi:hypothetical protein